MYLMKTTKIALKIGEIKIKSFWMPRDCLAYPFPLETLDTSGIVSCLLFYVIACFNFISQSTINHKKSFPKQSCL